MIYKDKTFVNVLLFILIVVKIMQKKWLYCALISNYVV